MESNRLKLNFGKTAGLWVQGSWVPGELPLLVVDSVALPQTDLVCNLEVFLESFCLLKERAEVMARISYKISTENPKSIVF